MPLRNNASQLAILSVKSDKTPGFRCALAANWPIFANLAAQSRYVNSALDLDFGRAFESIPSSKGGQSIRVLEEHAGSALRRLREVTQACFPKVTQAVCS
jgi:hypothetical protein